MTQLSALPSAIHRGHGELPWVYGGEGIELQLLQVSVDDGLWIVRNRFSPGVRVQRHRHTGSVHAFTIAGAWKYEEYPEVNRAGSYLYEPAGSVHTLTALADNDGPTDAWFVIHGANLNLDPEGNVERVLDAAWVLRFYLRQCEEAGLPRPAVIGA